MIEFDIGGRKIGKTTRMLQWLEDAPVGELKMMVVHSAHEADRLAKLCDDLGYKNITRSHFVTLSSIDELRGFPDRTKLGVDNIDLMLRYLFNIEVARVSATGIDVLREIGDE